MRGLVVYIAFLISMPVIGRELVCDTKGISEAFWQGNEAISVIVNRVVQVSRFMRHTY